MPVETTSADSYREDLVSSGVVIKTEELAKVYEMGAEKVHALRAGGDTAAGTDRRSLPAKNRRAAGPDATADPHRGA